MTLESRERWIKAAAGWEARADQFARDTLPVSAAIDVSRTAVRRAERRAVELADQGRTVGPDAIPYLNRLSDLLFALARQMAGEGDVPSRDRDRPGP